MATKAQMKRQMDEAWRSLGETLVTLGEEEMLEPGVVGEWSVKDLLRHIAFWDYEVAKIIELTAAGQVERILRPGSEEAIDQWNEREWRKRREWSLVRVRDEWQESHRKVEEALAPFPDDKLGLDLGEHTFLELFAEDTYEHYQEHGEDILAWRREVETTEA